jgi:curli biogenesis system outer membrane secretion channel CsgG
MKKRFASVLTLVAALAATGVSTASAQGTNVGAQVASINQTSLASSSATQIAGFSFNWNSSSAESANYAAIVQLLSQH